VVTSKPLFCFDEETKKMRLLGTLKCLNPEDFLQGLGFTPLVAEKLQVFGPPKLDELNLLRKRSTSRASSSQARKCGRSGRLATATADVQEELIRNFILATNQGRASFGLFMAEFILELVDNLPNKKLL
jgi:hypothetical protein